MMPVMGATTAAVETKEMVVILEHWSTHLELLIPSHRQRVLWSSCSAATVPGQSRCTASSHFWPPARMVLWAISSSKCCPCTQRTSS